MKRFSHVFLFVLMIATLLLSACGGTAATPAASVGGGKVEPIPVAFIGVVESMAGDQWVINGQTVTVAPDVVREGPFIVGDQVKVEGVVNADGSFSISRVEAPTPQDSSSLPQFGADNSNDANSTDLNANDANSNVNDANSNDDNSNTVNTNDANSNDDNSNNANSNDDSNANDDNGNESNANEDNSNDSNSNDDNGGNDNSDDNNGNNDHSDSGGNDNGGNDDNGGGSDDNGGADSNDD